MASSRGLQKSCTNEDHYQSRLTPSLEQTDGEARKGTLRKRPALQNEFEMRALESYLFLDKNFHVLKSIHGMIQLYLAGCTQPSERQGVHKMS
jgi:hypothetical protein